jgi:hypothetical protein
MLTKEISLSFLNHKISQVQQLIEQGYSLIVRNERTKNIIFTINPPEPKIITKDDEDFIDATSNLDDYLIPFTEEELKLPYEAQLEAAKKYNKKTYARFISPYGQNQASEV